MRITIVHRAREKTMLNVMRLLLTLFRVGAIIHIRGKLAISDLLTDEIFEIYEMEWG